MKKIYILLAFYFLFSLAQAQPVKFNYFDKVPFLKPNTTDTLLYPFTGGLNSPQFNTIDLDGDGVKDLFIFERAGNKVITFLKKNNKYVYAPKYEAMFPPLNNWVILRDYNCDGKEDIFTEVNYNAQPDPSKFIYPGGVRVLKNVSTKVGEFKWFQAENQMYDTGSVGSPPVNIMLYNADMPAIEDMDNDGDIDLLVMPFGKNVLTLYQNMSKELGYHCDSLIYVFRDECWGYMSYKVLKNEFVLADPSPCARNYGKTAMHNGTTLCMFDKDNDGDKDLIYGDVSYNTLVLLENGKSSNYRNRDTIISQDTIFPRNTTPANTDLFPAAYMIDVDADNKKDMLIAPNADVGAKNNNQIYFYKNTGTSTVPVFQFQKNNYLIDEMIDLGGGSSPVFVDIDGDNDKDIVVATQGEFTQTNNSNDRLILFKNMGTANNPLYQLADTNFLGVNNSVTKINRIMPTFGDLNGDGKPDLLIGDLNGKFHCYENTSVGSSITFNKLSSDYFSMYAGTSAAPQLFDLNKDGKLDIIMGRKNGTLAYFENSGTAQAPIFTSNATIDSIGKFTVAESFLSGGVPYYFDGYTTPQVCDLDNDGRFEIILGSDQGRVFLFNNFEANANRICLPIDNIFFDDPAATPSILKFGSKTAVSVADINNDGKSELVIGNSRGGLRIYQAAINGVISGMKNQIQDDWGWKVFPNPTQGVLHVNGNHNLKGMDFVIYSIIGEQIMKGKFDNYTNEVDVAALENGLYFLQASDSKGNKMVSRFLIQ